MRVRLLLSILLISAAVSLFYTEGCKSKPPRCEVCDRDIHPGMQARLVMNGKPRTTCCVACAMHLKLGNKAAVIQSATDYRTGKEIDAAGAVYLFNPQIETCVTNTGAVRAGDSAAYVCFDRCHPSVVAFQSRAEALAVQKEYGGTMASLTELQHIFEKLHTEGHN